MYVLGDFSSSDFNSTKYPGICKPSTANALAAFKALQQQLNRVASVKGVSKIAVDGVIGPGTVQLANYVKAFAADDSTATTTTTSAPSQDSWLTISGIFGTGAQSGSSSGNAAFAAGAVMGIDMSSCSAVASKADSIASAVQAYANALGVPPAVVAPVNTAPTVLVSSGGQETQVSSGAANAAADLAANAASLSPIEMVAVVGALGIAGWIVWGGKPRRKRR